LPVAGVAQYLLSSAPRLWRRCISAVGAGGGAETCGAELSSAELSGAETFSAGS